jgi:drug/metabolite transporter (DMT)-like permease
MSNFSNILMEVSKDIILSVLNLLTEWWVILLIIAGLCHAIVEFIDEHLLDHLKEESPVGNSVGTLTLISGLFGAIISIAFLLFVLITDSVDALLVNQTQATIALVAGALEVIWMIPYLHAINRGGAINASPLFQLIPIFTLVLGLVVFGEYPLLEHVLGGFAIVGGVFILNCKPGTFRLDRKTVLLMSLASLIISVVYFLFKEVVVEESFVASAFWSGIGMTIMSLALWAGYRPYREEFNTFLTSSKQRALYWQTANEGINSAGALLTHLAIARAPSVMLASTLNACHPIFTLLIGWVLGKRGSKKHSSALAGGELYRKIIAILLLVVGTILIAQT